MLAINHTSALDQQILQKLEDSQEQRKQKTKAFDAKIKMRKALSAVKKNSALGHAHGGKNPKAHISVFLAMATAIVAQMENNLKTMSAQAEHMLVLDNNNKEYSEQLTDLQKKADSITNTTDGSSLPATAAVSAEMNIVSNQMNVNQQNEKIDANATQSFQTNTSSDKGAAQAIADADNAVFKPFK